MALTPRCAIGVAVGTGNFAFTLALTGWTNLGGPAGTAPADGDVILITAYNQGTSSGTWSQSGGTGTWTIHSDTNAMAADPFNTFLGSIVWSAAADTAPTFTQSAAHSGRCSYAAVALAPDSGFVGSVDVLAATKIDTAGSSTSFTPTAATAAASGEVSVILSDFIAGAVGAVAISISTQVPGYTSAEAFSQIGTAGSFSGFISIATLTGQGPGTITPGAEVTNVACGANIYTVLVREIAAAPAVFQQPGGRAWRRRYRRHQTARPPLPPPLEGWGRPA
jgi:hypothetical protein